MKVRYTRRASTDLREIYDFIEKDSPQSAIQIERLLQQLIDGLADFPNAGRTTDIPDIRALIAGRFPYVIFLSCAERRSACSPYPARRSRDMVRPIERGRVVL